MFIRYLSVALCWFIVSAHLVGCGGQQVDKEQTTSTEETAPSGARDDAQGNEVQHRTERQTTRPTSFGKQGLQTDANESKKPEDTDRHVVVAPADDESKERNPSKLRVLAWPSSQQPEMFRALEHEAGSFVTDKDARPPWVFVFAVKEGAQQIRGIYIQRPEDPDASPPTQWYVGTSPTPVEVSRESFRSVLSIIERKGHGKETDSSTFNHTIYLAFDAPVRAALVVLQMSHNKRGVPMTVGTIDIRLAGEPLRQGVKVVELQRTAQKEQAGTQVLLAPEQEESLSDTNGPMDAMKATGSDNHSKEEENLEPEEPGETTKQEGGDE